MADTVRAHKLYDSPDTVILLLTNVSDGTGESEVKKVDLKALEIVDPKRRRYAFIKSIRYSTSGMGVRIYWQGESNHLAWTLPANSAGIEHFEADGSLWRSLWPPSNATGDILFSTYGHEPGASYSIILTLSKE